jgi:hypothetical protein
VGVSTDAFFPRYRITTDNQTHASHMTAKVNVELKPGQPRDLQPAKNPTLQTLFGVIDF